MSRDASGPKEGGTVIANQEHVKQLQQGTDHWNTWRKENPEVRPDLSETNLNRANLSGANLFGADLSGADLSETDMKADQVKTRVALQAEGQMRWPRR